MLLLAPFGRSAAIIIMETFVFKFTIVNLATYRQFTNAACDWIIKKKTKTKRKEIKIALSLGYPNSYFYNKRCNMLLS